MTKKQTAKKVVLPPHLQAMADKWQKMIDVGEAKPIVITTVITSVVTDVTPQGYGPQDNK